MFVEPCRNADWICGRYTIPKLDRTFGNGLMSKFSNSLPRIPGFYHPIVYPEQRDRSVAPLLRAYVLVQDPVGFLPAESEHSDVWRNASQSSRRQADP